MDDVPKILVSIAEKGGPTVAALLLILSLVEAWIIRYLYKELRRAEKEHKTELADISANRDEMFHDRLEDASKVILALEHNSQSNLALERSSEQRVIAIGKLGEGFVQLASDIKRQEDWRRDLAQRFERLLENLVSRVDTLAGKIAELQNRRH